MPAPSISFEIDGQQVPIEDCCWVEVAPCGCICGVTATKHVDVGYLLTPEQAGRHFCENAREYEKSVAQGSSWKVMTREAFESCPMTCDHDPKWGVRRLPKEIPGWQYAARYRARTKHLVPRDIDPRSDTRVSTLCGRMKERSYLWRTAEYVHQRLPVCAACEKAAFALLDAEPVPDA